MLQKCPVCDGQGLVSRPPGIAGDVTTWVDSSTGPYTCRRCGGSGTIPLEGSGTIPLEWVDSTPGS